MDTFTHPSMKGHTIWRLDTDWFFLYNPFSAPRHLTKSPLFILLQGESNHVRVQRTCDWLALSPCDYLHFIQSGRCTGTKSSACDSHLSLSLSQPPQTSHTLLALVCTEELYFVVSISILLSLTCVRFHISAQFSGLDSKWYFKIVFMITMIMWLRKKFPPVIWNTRL